jgi:urocanate reductase
MVLKLRKVKGWSLKMTNLKKFFSIVLTLCLILSFTACSGNKDKDETVETDKVTESNGSTSDEKDEAVDATSQASIKVDESGLRTIPVMEAEKETEENQTYDVVIVGAGGAGLAAAISAAENGASVVVLEKMPIVGGNTSWSGAGMDIPGNWVQKTQNIEDSIELYTKDTLVGGDNTNITELVDVLAENALPTAEWLKDYVGVEFMEDFQKHFGGHTVARAIVVKGGIGSELIMSELDKALELGVTIKANTEAKELIKNDAGRIVGVKALNTLDQNLTFNATKGVILASGGFAGSVEMRKQFDSLLDEKVGTTNAPGHTGDGIIMAQKFDAATTHMEWIQTYPFCFSTTGKISFVADTRMYGAPMVNVEGKRFVEESDRRDVVSKAILSQSDSHGYMVWDAAIMKEAKTLEIYGEEYNSLVEDKLLIEADTLEEAAKFFNIDEKQLLETINTYNEYAEDFLSGTDSTEADKEWNRKAKLAKVENGPFYIEKVIPSAHHTMGGLLINTECKVVNTNGDVIEGLYAAGEVVGGIHGNNRLGGNALTDITVFGKLAGKYAAK